MLTSHECWSWLVAKIEVGAARCGSGGSNSSRISRGGLPKWFGLDLEAEVAGESEGVDGLLHSRPLGARWHGWRPLVASPSSFPGTSPEACRRAAICPGRLAWRSCCVSCNTETGQHHATLHFDVDGGFWFRDLGPQLVLLFCPLLGRLLARWLECGYPASGNGGLRVLVEVRSLVLAAGHQDGLRHEGLWVRSTRPGCHDLQLGVWTGCHRLPAVTDSSSWLAAPNMCAIHDSADWPLQ